VLPFPHLAGECFVSQLNCNTLVLHHQRGFFILLPVNQGIPAGILFEQRFGLFTNEHRLELLCSRMNIRRRRFKETFYQQLAYNERPVAAPHHVRRIVRQRTC
jgi:hypothetical protein